MQKREEKNGKNKEGIFPFPVNLHIDFIYKTLLYIYNAFKQYIEFSIYSYAQNIL